MNEGRRFNSRKGDKKLSLLLMLRMLQKWSSREYPIQQSQIVDYINNCAEAEIWCDRKTVARHLKVLKQAGYRVEYVKRRGWYLESDAFTKDEYDLLLGVIAQSSLSAEQKIELASKLAAQKTYDVKL